MSSELEEEDIIDIPLSESETFNNYLICKAEYSVYAKLLDKKYIFVKLIPYSSYKNYSETFEPLFFLIDIAAKEYYQLPCSLSRTIKNINMTEVHLFDSKYLFFEISNLGNSEKYDLLISNEESDISSVNYYTQKHIIYPFEQFKADVIKNSVDLEKYTLTTAQTEAVLPFYFIEDDNYYYLKTYVNENKSEFYKINLSENSNNPILICSTRERILENSRFTNYRIIKGRKIDKKDVLYIAREIIESQRVSTIESLYIGEKMLTKNYNTFRFDRNERCFDICESDGYLVTAKFSQTDGFIFRFFSLFDKSLLLQTRPCSKILYFSNPLNNEEVLVIPY
ncbi:hypothetical protein [Caldicellulosiruptor morganii]|uniref:Uncharacterized protein n=2 Tax=Caldicellulosiruptor morganii TaxID=1387555 RepID=A0ABY7BMA3_9FIRM|nr:hypothetical protein [Caldicellulosiruptor morganii]WAM33983.1 hypothetical protein OTK00_000126 [Caldicellulosiruptor morganii]